MRDYDEIKKLCLCGECNAEVPEDGGQIDDVRLKCKNAYTVGVLTQDDDVVATLDVLEGLAMTAEDEVLAAALQILWSRLDAFTAMVDVTEAIDDEG